MGVRESIRERRDMQRKSLREGVNGVKSVGIMVRVYRVYGFYRSEIWEK